MILMYLGLDKLVYLFLECPIPKHIIDNFIL